MEENVQAKFDEKLKELVNIGKKRGFLDYQFINDFFNSSFRTFHRWINHVNLSTFSRSRALRESVCL